MKTLSGKDIDAKQYLLSLLKLDKHFEAGEKDWLFFQEDGKKNKVLDLVGSYGINILGHNNQEVKNEFISIINSNQSAFVQGSLNPKSAELSTKINDFINTETEYKGRFCEYTSTGTEAVEIALKLCILDYQARLEEVRQHINFTENILRKLKHKDAEKVISENRNIDFKGYLLHLENSFHGKTLGSLSAIDNKKLKHSFTTAIDAIKVNCSPSNLDSILNEKEISYWDYNKRNGKVLKKTFCPFLAFILEPIRGEGGVLPLTKNFALEIKKASKNHNFPLISDEIQTGLFRTQKMAALHHFNIDADIYCFAKGLGGGFTKIGAVSALEKRFDRHFFRYHSSSFGEDFYSTTIACKVLNILKEQTKSNFPDLKGFDVLKEKFPELVKSVRGMGLLFAFELNVDLVLISYLRKYLSNIDMVGYWISSVLLNKESIRILPTLSTPLTFRIEPSIYISKNDIQFALNGIIKFLNALRSRDAGYLFEHILPIAKHDKEKEISLPLIRNEFPKNAAVFLCHPVNTAHFQSFFDLTTNVADDVLENIVDELAPLQEFYPYHISKLQGKKGNEINVVYLGIPLTSQSFYNAIKIGKRSDIIARIQRAIDWANERNAKVVGLGQFTSIITENGLRLKSKKAVLTTGNAFTAQVTIEAISKSLQEKSIEIHNASFGIVGAAGNIMSVITKVLSKKAKHLTLIFNHSIWDIKKNVTVIADLLQFMSKFHPEKEVRSFLSDNIDNASPKEIVQNPLVQNFIKVDTKLNTMSYCDVVLSGTNATEAFIEGFQLNPNVIAVDLAVPPNIKVDSLWSTQTYIKGGIIQLPVIDGKEQVLDSAIFPLKAGESYACMAETMGLALHNYKGSHLIGDIDIESVDSVNSILKLQGFQLKRIKIIDSV